MHVAENMTKCPPMGGERWRRFNYSRVKKLKTKNVLIKHNKKHNRKTVQQRTTEGTTSRQNSEDQNAPITAHQRDINGTA